MVDSHVHAFQQLAKTIMILATFGKDSLANSGQDWISGFYMLFLAQESSESGWHSLGKNIIRCVLAQYHFLFSSKLVRIFHCTSVSRWVRTQGINQAPHLCILGVFWETPDWIPS